MVVTKSNTACSEIQQTVSVFPFEPGTINVGQPEGHLVISAPRRYLRHNPVVATVSAEVNLEPLQQNEK